MNTTIASYRLINFHIRNDQPFDNDDIFYGVQQIYSNPTHYGNLVSEDLTGTTVDTTLMGRTVFDTVRYVYTFKKNGILNTVTDSLIGVCNDTVLVDLFY
jgi:hypothetical protein